MSKCGTSSLGLCGLTARDKQKRHAIKICTERAHESFHIFRRATTRRGVLSVPLSDGKKVFARSCCVAKSKRVCDATVTYYSRATFHYMSFHSAPRTYYWHVFPLALSRVPIGRIGKSFLFPRAVICHATHVEARSPIVASVLFYVNV